VSVVLILCIPHTHYIISRFLYENLHSLLVNWWSISVMEGIICDMVMFKGENGLYWKCFCLWLKITEESMVGLLPRSLGLTFLAGSCITCLGNQRLNLTKTNTQPTSWGEWNTQKFLPKSESTLTSSLEESQHTRMNKVTIWNLVCFLSDHHENFIVPLCIL
jgi:hypothetical protein